MGFENKNIIAISLAFPPLAYPRSIQVARLLKNWGGQAFVFCADEPDTRTDPTIESDPAHRLAGLVRVPVQTSRLERLEDKLSYKYLRSYWNRRNLVPDKYSTWRHDVIRAVHDHISTDAIRPDAIVSFAQPFSDHLIGLTLKKELGVPWLAHFSDPWTDNPFTPYDRKTYELNLELERQVAENADLLVFTSTETVELFCLKYPESVNKKCRVLPQCFDETRYPRSKTSASENICIRYLGNFYGHRKPKALFGGLSKLLLNDPERLRHVTIELIGPGNTEETIALASDLPNGLVSARSSVDYSESLRLMSEADGLLVIDAPSDLSVFLPSKLIDYIGAGRPIVGVTPTGTAASLILELGGMVADPSSESEIADTFGKFIQKLKIRRSNNDLSVWGESRVRARFTIENVVSKFDSLLTELQALR